MKVNDFKRICLIWAIFILAALLRLLVIYAYRGYLGGDEAIVGLMAKHMLDGEGFPLFYYGQSYMGSLEAMLSALLFAFGGISVICLRLAPFIFSMLFLLILYFSAKRFSAPGIPILSLLLAALPPVFFLRWSVWARGGFIEVLFWGQLSLFLLSYVMEFPASPRYYLLVGLTLGVGFWINPLIMPYLLTVGCFLLAIVLRQKKHRWRLLAFLIFSFILGASPLIAYNLVHPAATGIYLVKSFAGITRSTWNARGLWGSFLLFLKRRLWLYPISAPRSLAALFQISNGSALNWLSWAISLSLLSLFLCLGLSRRLKFPQRWQQQMASVYALLLLLTLFLGCSGKFIPRYFLPIYSVYPIACGLVLIRLKSKNFILSVVLLTALIVFNLLGAISAARYPRSRDLSSLIDVLNELRISRGYADYGTSYCINFLTRENVILSPSIPASFGLADRYPGYTAEVDRFINRAYIFLSGSEEQKTFIRQLRRASLGFEQRKINGYTLYYNVSNPLTSHDLKKLFLDDIKGGTG